MYPRHRLDGLADAIYGVAMTLLVLEIRLPEGFAPRTDQDLINALSALAPKFWPYALSFAVLGLRWRAMFKDRGGDDHGEVGRAYANWWLIHLFLVTLVPFSSMVMGDYASRAPAVWIYSANLAGLSIAGWRLAALAPGEGREKLAEIRGGVIMLLISAALAVAVSFWNTPYASLAFLLNAFGRPLSRILDRRKASAPV
jgi:uncharacterized membrane protein